MDAWCIAGDFNMIESLKDRQGGSQIMVHGIELAAWEQLCMALGLHDVWHLADLARERDSLGFSRSDRRIGGMNLSRIDRIYVSDALSDYGGTTSIIAGSCMSDHAPVVVVFRERDAHVSTVMCIPESVQLDESLTEQIEMIWGQLSWDEGARGQSLAEGHQQISRFFHVTSTQRLAQLRETKRCLHRGLASLQRILERHPDSECAGTQLMQAQ